MQQEIVDSELVRLKDDPKFKNLIKNISGKFLVDISKLAV